MTTEKMNWCYGSGEDAEGDPVEVEIVDLGEKTNAELRRLHQQPTNLNEIPIFEEKK